METGRLSSKEFRNEIRKFFNINASDKEIDEAWNSMLNKTSKETLLLVNNLRSKYKTFLLSNTNQIHIDWVNAQLQKDYNIQSLEPYFDKIYFSHKIKCRKPSKKPFQIVLKENNLIAKQTIFIDDKQENINTAKEIGIHTYLKKDETPLKKILENIDKEKF